MSIREYTKGYWFELFHTSYTYPTHITTCRTLCTCMKDLEKIYNIFTCMVRALICAHLFGSMEKDEECDYDHILIDDSNAQGGDKENCSVVKSNMLQGCCQKDIIDVVTTWK